MLETDGKLYYFSITGNPTDVCYDATADVIWFIKNSSLYSIVRSTSSIPKKIFTPSGTTLTRVEVVSSVVYMQTSTQIITQSGTYADNATMKKIHGVEGIEITTDTDVYVLGETISPITYDPKRHKDYDTSVVHISNSVF